jgi:hypothetical protein
MEEFQDFEAYMKSINEYGMRSGIAKVIPPKEWVSSLPVIDTEKLQSIKIRNPIVQHINGRNGVFSQQNVEKQRTFNIVQWKALSQEMSHQPPAPRGKIRNTASSGAAKQNRRILANKNHNDDEMFNGFQYNIDTEEFTPERCEQLEKVYWKGLTYAEPMYGADMLGSIFDDSLKCWNVAHLPNVLDNMDVKLPGVNDAYLYAGLWKATFAWHLEDQDLYSINYLHFGAPKQWYSIPQGDKARFEAVVRDLFTDEYKNCPDFLRHKTFLVSPQYLESKGVTVNKVVHYEREFMITYPYGYHAGMNYGYNLAESVNFAIEEWFEFGLKTSKCLCVSDAVAIDVEALMKKTYGGGNLKDGTNANASDPETEVENETDEVIPSKADLKQEYTSFESNKCILCPVQINGSQKQHDDLALIPTDQLNKDHQVLHCHKICAKLIPEIVLLDFATKGLSARLMETIPQDGKDQGCSYCLSKSGVFIECSQQDCHKSYHGICSLAGGLYFKSYNEYYCPEHRITHEKASEYTDTLAINDLIQLKINGTYLAGTIQSINKDQQTLEVDLFLLTQLRQVIQVSFNDVATQGVNLSGTRITKINENIQVGSPRAERSVKRRKIESVGLPEIHGLLNSPPPAAELSQPFSAHVGAFYTESKSDHNNDGNYMDLISQVGSSQSKVNPHFTPQPIVEVVHSSNPHHTNALHAPPTQAPSAQ